MTSIGSIQSDKVKRTSNSPLHSGAKSKMYEQKYLNYNFRCKKKYEVKLFKILGGGGASLDDYKSVKVMW